jgi:hypothetical protein
MEAGMTQTVSLRQPELDFLRSHTHAIDMGRAVPVTSTLHALERKRRWVVTLSENEIDAILDELADLFVSIGLQDESDEPNSTGLFIEGLIDIFVRHKIWP